MSAKGCSLDNAACEGFFSRLKNEFFHHYGWSGVTPEEFMERLDAYLRYYCRGKLRSMLPRLKARVASTDEATLSDAAAILAAAGVVLQFVETSDEFPLHGMTMWTGGGSRHSDDQAAQEGWVHRLDPVPRAGGATGSQAEEFSGGKKGVSEWARLMS